MFVPSIFSDNFVDNLFDDMFFRPQSAVSRRDTSSLMSTDIQDLGDDYQVEIELPGYEKKDIHAELNDGYLTISASRDASCDSKDKEGKYVRRERYYGNCRRSFYVGGNLKETDIHASFENGILKLVFPKEEKRRSAQEKKFISIE